MQVQQGSKRQSWVDYARGIAIILVAYRHVFEGIKSSHIPVSNYLYLEHFNIVFFSFRMPLFFIVSGIFLSASFAKRGLRKYIENKARIILYPYFLWGCIQITLQIIFADYTNGSRDLHSYLYLLYLPNEIEQFWYLYALFNVSVLYVLLKYVLKLNKVYQYLLAVVMFYTAAVCHQKNFNIGFVSDILHNYIFILLGDTISKAIRNKENLKRLESWTLSALLIIPFAISQLFFLLKNLNYPGMKFRYIEYYQPFLFLAIALTGCAFVISVCFLLQRYNNFAWLRKIGRYSLYIYVSHVIVFAGLRAFTVHYLHISNVPFLLITGILSGLFVPIVLYELSVKFNMEWLFTLEKSTAPKNTSSTDLTQAGIIK